MVSLLPEVCVESLRQRFGNSLDELGPEDVQILAMAHEEGEITNLRLQEVLTIHRTDVTKVLQSLVKRGFLIRQGFGRWTKYVLTGDGGDPMPVITDTSTDTHPPESRGVTAGSAPEQIDMRPLQTRNPSIWQSLLEGSAQVRQRAKMSPRELQRAALGMFGKADWLTRNELALLLGRNSENIRDSVLNAVLEEGAIRPRFKAKNHPQQAYAAVLVAE